MDPHFISDDELLRWLEEDEARTRPSRVERLRLLVEEYGSEGELRWFPGQVTYWAFNEARLAYLQGLFLACILLCQVCVEHVLGGLFMMAGDDKAARANFGQMLRAAGREGYLSAEEVDLFNRLRGTRNPYAHPRPFTPPDQEREEVDLEQLNQMERAGQLCARPDDLLVEDARDAIVALLRLLRRTPFRS